jgi:hypothetical protein
MILIEKQSIIYKRIILFKIHVKTSYEKSINNKIFYSSQNNFNQHETFFIYLKISYERDVFFRQQ